MDFKRHIVIGIKKRLWLRMKTEGAFLLLLLVAVVVSESGNSSSIRWRRITTLPEFISLYE